MIGEAISWEGQALRSRMLVSCLSVLLACSHCNVGEEGVAVSTSSTPGSTDVGSRMSLLPSSRLGRSTQPVLQQRIDCQRSGTSEHDKQQR